ncbi:enoyl-CoA hydratase-related protein [Pontivivens nitratireducens]|uniref:2-(1,2-epoxy-1,2-dihydrophenyl)acetyl-CoA isomerase n=1 Tax=Pontivivens nitratireducens TaxID=2758038 RepID=A0A6G7VMD7_9RHOB|nr:enoyl-CoA hydratase-related protein [Pontibrevibacter nitratireducens]QIK41092.1 2-(1,2-epoxy-1,2-dihydrophenyl)acetyl-CoA isomerase [Pontibrevibacter nitratireducens]
MTFETILYDVSEGLATITLNRPDVMNGLNTRMRAEIRTAVELAGKEARALVLTGSGRGFCSGQDLADTAGKIVDMEQTLHDEYEPMLRAIYDCPIPTLAAVNGAAAGAGANLALAADIVIATESAFFLQAFARIGLIPDAGGTYWMPRQMGFAKAMGAALLADKITARQADDWGLIWAAIPDDRFEDQIAARARQLATGPTQAYARIKQALRASYDNDLDQQLKLEARLQGEAGNTRDFVEGVTAFLEKRPAKYQGR